MINNNSIKDVNASNFSDSFRKPLYESYCFSNIPGTIENILTGDTNLNKLPTDTLEGIKENFDTVLLFFVDAFGWRFFEQYKDKYPTLQRFIKEGCVSKITSQFPSTTAAHVTTIHTTKRVDESGVFEWFYYEPLVDTTIAPLLFGYAGKEAKGLLESGINPNNFFPNETFYERLATKGVETHLFQSAAFTPSPYGDVVTKGLGHVHAFSSLDTALNELTQVINTTKQKTYIYFYYGVIDAMGHEFGTNSPQFTEAVDDFFTKLENLFVSQIAENSQKTIMLMTADHGQTDVDPKMTIYLNQVIPEITEWTKVNKKGELIIIGGSCRDLFLYIKEEYIEITISTLKQVLVGKAEVYKTEFLLNEGFFGDKPSDTLKSRLGNVCVLPYEHDSVYWWEEGRFEQTLIGHHGGLTPAEMESVFMAVEL